MLRALGLSDLLDDPARTLRIPAAAPESAAKPCPLPTLTIKLHTTRWVNNWRTCVFVAGFVDLLRVVYGALSRARSLSTRPMRWRARRGGRRCLRLRLLLLPRVLAMQTPRFQCLRTSRRDARSG